jgi:hypothetical protein
MISRVLIIIQYPSPQPVQRIARTQQDPDFRFSSYIGRGLLVRPIFFSSSLADFFHFSLADFFSFSTWSALGWAFAFFSFFFGCSRMARTVTVFLFLEGRFSIEIVEATKMSKNNWNLKT